MSLIIINIEFGVFTDGAKVVWRPCVSQAEMTTVADLDLGFANFQNTLFEALADYYHLSLERIKEKQPRFFIVNEAKKDKNCITSHVELLPSSFKVVVLKKPSELHVKSISLDVTCDSKTSQAPMKELSREVNNRILRFLGNLNHSTGVLVSIIKIGNRAGGTFRRVDVKSEIIQHGSELFVYVDGTKPQIHKTIKKLFIDKKGYIKNAPDYIPFVNKLELSREDNLTMILELRCKKNIW
jgi:hypothetical protein